MASLSATRSTTTAGALDADGRDGRGVMSVTMYSTTWCGYCQRLKAQLTREGIGWTEVDIEQDSDAAEFVMGVNGGNQTVPTLLFTDGSALTNPSIGEVKARLAGVG